MWLLFFVTAVTVRHEAGERGKEEREEGERERGEAKEKREQGRKRRGRKRWEEGEGSPNSIGFLLHIH